MRFSLPSSNPSSHKLCQLCFCLLFKFHLPTYLEKIAVESAPQLNLPYVCLQREEDVTFESKEAVGVGVCPIYLFVE